LNRAGKELVMAEDSKPTDCNGADRADVAPRPPDIARLVADHHRVLYRYAYRLTGSIPDAEDLTQQTFLVTQQKVGQLRDATKVRSWLFSVLRSCFLKSRRKKSPLPLASLEADVQAPDELLPHTDEIDRERIQAAINELPDDFRLVLVMFYFQECSYKEIAEELDTPMGTVMSRLSRAKGHLRRRLLDAQRRHEGRHDGETKTVKPAGLNT